MAGPERPRCVNSIASWKAGPCRAWASTGAETPDRLEKVSFRAPLNVKGTRAGLGAITSWPNWRAIS